MSPFVDELGQRFEDASELYYRLRQQEQAVNESLKQQHVLRRQVEHLEDLQAQAEAARTEESDLLEKRGILRSELRRIDDQIYELRIGEIDSINREHGNSIQLTLGSLVEQPRIRRTPTRIPGWFLDQIARGSSSDNRDQD